MAHVCDLNKPQPLKTVTITIVRSMFQNMGYLVFTNTVTSVTVFIIVNECSVLQILLVYCMHSKWVAQNNNTKWLSMQIVAMNK